MQEAQSFLAHVLPPDGPYVLAYVTKARKGMAHKIHDTTESMARMAMQLSERGADVYLCVGSILDKEFTNDKGNKVPRNQRNIKSIKCLILDVDVVDPANPGAKKAERFFNSKQEALAAITSFVEAVGLPRPTVIDSGGGYHVWFAMGPSLDRFDWVKLALKLKTAAADHSPKLIADSTRVMDSCSLLRIVGTNNYKIEGQPRKVHSIGEGVQTTPADYDECLTTYLAERDITAVSDEPVKRPPPALRNIPNTPIGPLVDISIGDDPHSFTDVLRKCNWAREYMVNQATEPEPHWYAMLGMMPYLRTRSMNGQQLAHIVSNKHPGYDAASTDKKYSQAANAQRGPTMCSKFRQLDKQRCEACPFAHAITTPIRLDMIDVPAEAPVIKQEIVNAEGEVRIEEIVIPKPPFPYFRGKNAPGIFMQIGEGEDAETKRIYEYDLFPIRRLKDEETDSEMLEMSLTLPQDGHRFVKISNGLLTDPKRLTSALAEKGVLVHPKEAISVASYIIEYARKIQREEKAHEEFARFGWRDLDTPKPRFVMGDFTLDSLGELRPATTASYLAPYKKIISVKGNLEDWKQSFAVYKDMGAQALPLQFALMMSFAAPLFAHTGFHGLIYNMLGDSGSGKSTALRLMTSVWGKPDEHHLQVQDNAIPMMNTIGYLQSVPISFDEMTTIDSETLSSLSYAISEGRGKNRADRSGNTRINTSQWKTLVVATSNASLYEKLGMSRSGNNAHAYRIFEVGVGPANLDYRPQIELAKALSENNYGMAGRVYIKYVLQNLNAVRKQIALATEHFTKVTNMPTAERYWFTLFACVATGGSIARKLGLHDYDMTTLVGWGMEQLNTVRKMVHTVEGDAFSMFAHFLQTNIRSTLVIKDKKADFVDLSSGGVFNLLVRLEYEKNQPLYGWVSVPALRAFCKLQGIEYGWLYKRLLDGKLILGQETKRLGEGTHMVTGSTQAWKIDLKHEAISGVKLHENL